MSKIGPIRIKEHAQFILLFTSLKLKSINNLLVIVSHDINWQISHFYLSQRKCVSCVFVEIYQWEPENSL